MGGKKPRRVFSFRHCVSCGGGKRRHVAVGFYGEYATWWFCSRGHQQIEHWSKERIRNVQTLEILKAMYRPYIEMRLKQDEAFLSWHNRRAGS